MWRIFQDFFQSSIKHFDILIRIEKLYRKKKEIHQYLNCLLFWFSRLYYNIYDLLKYTEMLSLIVLKDDDKNLPTLYTASPFFIYAMII